MRFLLISLFGVGTLCQASPIFTADFAPVTLSGNPGQAIQFSGMLLNNTASTEFINNDSFTFAIDSAVDDSPFLINAPLSLGPLASSGTFIFLDVAIPVGQAAGTYNGVLTVLGGTNGAAQDSLGSATFQVVVNSAVPANSAAPEPASLILVGAGLVSLLIWRNAGLYGHSFCTYRPD